MFAVPRIVFEADDGSFDVRAGVHGLVDPWLVYEKAKADRSLAVHIGSQLGAMLAEQHTRIVAEDVAAWLPSQPSWPEPILWIQERLPRVVADAPLLEGIDELLARYQAVPVVAADQVLVHGDLGFHNVAFDPASYDVRGVFDYDGVAWADRHFDFRYLPFALGHEEMLDAALAVYEPTVGLTLSRERIRLYNAGAAVSYLAYRDGVAPEQRWCGRTLDEDLAWVRHALAACL